MFKLWLSLNQRNFGKLGFSNNPMLQIGKRQIKSTVTFKIGFKHHSDWPVSQPLESCKCCDHIFNNASLSPISKRALTSSHYIDITEFYHITHITSSIFTNYINNNKTKWTWCSTNLQCNRRGNNLSNFVDQCRCQHRSTIQTTASSSTLSLLSPFSISLPC